VSLAKRVDGTLSELRKTESFEVVSLREPVLPGAPPQEMVAFLREVAELERAVGAADAAIEETQKRLTGITDALMRSTVADSSLDDEARALSRRIAELDEWLSGNRRRGRAGDPGPVSISRRLNVIEAGNRLSAYGPTPTHRRSFEIAVEELAELRERLQKVLDDELPALEKKLDAAGVPWTPGRGVPAVGQ
jgi:hypothetical protein